MVDSDARPRRVSVVLPEKLWGRLSAWQAVSGLAISAIVYRAADLWLREIKPLMELANARPVKENLPYSLLRAGEPTRRIHVTLPDHLVRRLNTAARWFGVDLAAVLRAALARDLSPNLTAFVRNFERLRAENPLLAELVRRVRQSYGWVPTSTVHAMVLHGIGQHDRPLLERDAAYWRQHPNEYRMHVAYLIGKLSPNERRRYTPLLQA